MAKNNFPQAGLENIEPSTTRNLISSLRDLHDKGKPQTEQEIKERIDDYFLFCESSSIRPGIESLCMALHISRTTLFNWAKGNGCSKECQELVLSAKSFIGAFIEQALLSGKISPPSGIFIMKNWLGYKDTLSIEESIPNNEHHKALTAADLPRLDHSILSENKVQFPLSNEEK